jgi:hypothetical protein
MTTAGLRGSAPVFRGEIDGSGTAVGIVATWRDVAHGCMKHQTSNSEHQ